MLDEDRILGQETRNKNRMWGKNEIEQVAEVRLKWEISRLGAQWRRRCGGRYRKKTRAGWVMRQGQSLGGGIDVR